MRLTKMAKACREYPFQDTCQNKRLEAHGYLMPVANENGVNSAAPLIRETLTIMVDGNPTIVYKDEIQKEIYKHLYSHLQLPFSREC